MNRKVNTALFLVVATLANIVLIAVYFTVPFMLAMAFLAPLLSKSLNLVVVVLIIFGAMIGAYLTYNAIMRRIATKLDFEKHFDPIFKPFVKKK